MKLLEETLPLSIMPETHHNTKSSACSLTSEELAKIRIQKEMEQQKRAFLKKLVEIQRRQRQELLRF